MSYYRIKIEERYNGEKLYVPQYCKLEIIRRVFQQQQRLVWYNIIPSETGFTISETLQVGYGTEESAMEVIEGYKNKDKIEAGKKIKSTTFKMID